MTRIISGEKYISGSLVIPITQGLTKTLVNLDSECIPAATRLHDTKRRLIEQVAHQISTTMPGAQETPVRYLIQPENLTSSI